ncbi:MAG: hypothetical protein IJN82_05345, partial [Clostridia bacterium]|nr:hypothetical protein [Clostridia bacterium]
NAEKTVVEASIQYQTGSQLICTFLRSDCMDDYWDVMTDDGVYEVEFGWPENNVVFYDRAGFYGEAQTLSTYVYEWGDRYEVYKTNTNLSRIVGGLIVSDGSYYYVDYAENQTDYANFYNLEEVQGYLITDHELIDRLDAGVGAYYQEDIGFLYDDSLSQRVTAVMLCVLFGAIPLGILIFALIQTIRKKGAYRKMFAFITAFSAAELAVFTVVAILLGIR